MFCLLQLLLLFPLIDYHGHITLAHKTLSRRGPKVPVMVASNIGAGPPLIQARNSSYITPSAVAIRNSSHSVINVTTALPALFDMNNTVGYGDRKRKRLTNYRDVKSGFCAIGDNFCSFKDSNGTSHDANPTDFSDQCLLWDDSCSGNRKMAIKRFFDISFKKQVPNDPDWNGNLLDNDCFVEVDYVKKSDCDTYNPPERLLEFQKIKKWMRSPQCVSAANEWIAMTGKPWGNVFDQGFNESHADYIAGNAFDKKYQNARSGSDYDNSSDADPSCCGVCQVWAPNVDLYYWPKPEANLSCTSIIGASIRPLDYGATTTTVIAEGTTFAPDTYWGCEVTSSLRIGSYPGELTTWVENVTTAVITTIGSLTVKMSSYSPWSSPVCGEDVAGPQSSNQSTKFDERHGTIYPRGHSLVVPPSIINTDGSPISTVVSGEFTFTSPSVYANFYSLSITDGCGGSMISSVMLSFSVGELSTIVGNLKMNEGMPYPPRLTTQRFDVNDLPCPPQGVMEANWYKPQPGEPYRPLIAMPSQLKQKYPWMSYCTDGLFTAYDPPSALVTVSAIAPPIPPGDSNAPSSAPVPTSTIDFGIRQTVGAEWSIPVPASIPKVDQPKATINTTPNPPQEWGSDPGPLPFKPATHESSPSQPNTEQLNGDPKAGNNPQQNSHSDQGSGDSRDPGHGADLKSNNDYKDNDPQQGSGNSGVSGHEADNKANGDPDQVNSNQGSNQVADSVPQSDPTQINPLYGLIESQTVTVNSQMVQPLSHGISIAGTTLTPGATPVAVAGSPIYSGSSALVTGINTRSLIHTVVKPIVTSIAAQAITAAPNAVIIAGTTLNPGAPGIKLDGISISFNSANQLMIGSKTVPLESTSMTTKIGGYVITTASNNIVIDGTTLTPGVLGVTIGGTLVSLNTAGHLILDSKTIALQSGQTTRSVGHLAGALEAGALADPLTTIVDSYTITAGPAAALAMAGTTLTPGAPGLTLNRTLVSLNTAAKLVVGSQSIPLEGKQTAGSGGLLRGAFGSGGGPVGLPSSTLRNSSTRAANGTTTSSSVQVFEGNAVYQKDYFLWNKVAISAVALSVLLYIH